MKLSANIKKRMKLSAEEFKALFAKAGNKMTAKGRPIIDLSLIKETAESLPKANRRVLNANKVVDLQGNVLADSKWEHRCKSVLEDAGLEFEFQRRFELLPTVRDKKTGTLRARKWTPDFCFERFKIVADAKGYMTEMAKIKVHLFLHFYPEWDVYLLKNKSDLFTFINYIKQIQNE